MLETFMGIMLILASGLLGHERLLKEQPSLKITLHHLDAYRDVIGLCCLIGGLLGIYHSLSTALTHVYTPIYWLAWASSNLIAVLTGQALCFAIISARINRISMEVYQWCARLTEVVIAAPSRLSWLGLGLGAWRALYPWLSAESF
jgi:hypothetical protein